MGVSSFIKKPFGQIEANIQWSIDWVMLKFLS